MDKINWQNGVTPLNKETMDNFQNNIQNGFGTDTDTYSSEKTYNVDDIVIYENNLYKCKTAITVGEQFDLSKWQKISLKDYVDYIKTILSKVVTTTMNGLMLASDKKKLNNMFVSYDFSLTVDLNDIKDSGFYQLNGWGDKINNKPAIGWIFLIVIKHIGSNIYQYAIINQTSTTIIKSRIYSGNNWTEWK